MSASTWMSLAVNHYHDTPDFAKLARAAKLVGVSLNVAIITWTVFFTGRSVYRALRLKQEKVKQSTSFVERIWNVVAQTGCKAAVVPPDLGEPDEHGVYTKQSCVGKLYFRVVKDSHGVDTWEWSIDKLLWIPTAYADSFWYATDSSPSEADKIVIRQLEVETELRRRQLRRSPVVWQPPALDISMAKRDMSHLDAALLPSEFLCPISMKLMTDPVVTPTGMTYDRESLERWIHRNHTDPATGQPLDAHQLYPNLCLRDMIQKWLVQPDLYS